MQLVYKSTNWIIKDELTGMFFSLLGSPHFTNNFELAQIFKSEKDAIIVEENFIHCEEKFLQYNTISVQL